MMDVGLRWKMGLLLKLVVVKAAGRKKAGGSEQGLRGRESR